MLFNILKKYEKFMIQALMVMMAIVLGLATLDLGWLIIKDIIQPPYLLLDVNQLLEIFGLFMLVVIGIETSGNHNEDLHNSRATSL